MLLQTDIISICLCKKSYVNLNGVLTVVEHYWYEIEKMLTAIRHFVLVSRSKTKYFSLV